MITPASIRVCLVGSFPAAGGGYTNVGDLLARRFAADRHQVITTSRRRLRVTKLLDILGTLVLRRDAYDIAIVEVFSTSAIWYALLAIRLARRLGKKTVAVLHGGGLPRLAREKPARLRAVLAPADAVAAPSAYLQREVGDRLGIGVQVIPNPVELDRYPRRLRRRARPRLLWIRAFHEVYLPEVAIRTLALLRKDYPAAHLTMAGPAKDATWGRCRKLAEELGLADAVEFPGLIDKRRIGEIGDASDIFINTSSVDNAPLSVMEALTMGLCVVTTNVGGVPALVEDGKDALLVSPGSADEMVAAVRRILEDPQAAESLSTQALATSERFEIGRVAAQWYALLAGLAEGRREHGPLPARVPESDRPAC